MVIIVSGDVTTRSDGQFGLESSDFAPLGGGSAVKFEVRYPGGAVHEVALDARVAAVGRDPSCDLVINDPKCSRRHAVVESGPGGVVIRDTGSANGIVVNGRKAERAPLVAGDVFRIGDVDVAFLGTADAGTLVMDALDSGSQPPHLRTATLPPLESLQGDTGSLPQPVPAVPPRAETRPRTTAPRHPSPTTPKHAGAPPSRPLTISVLSVLWILSIPFHAVMGIVLAQGLPGAPGLAVAALAALLAIVAGVMSFGLWTARSWARPAQIALAAIGIVNCPFAIASIATLVYMLRPSARRYFARQPAEGPGDAEAVFAAAIVAAVVLGGLVTAGLTFVARTARAPATFEARAAAPPAR
jgi:hypothetical protein